MYRGKSKRRALRAAKRNHEDLVSSPIWEPPRLKQGERIKEYTSDTSAIVDVAGTEDDALVESILPFSVTGADGTRRPVSTTLKPKGSSHSPHRSATKVDIPRKLGDGIALGEHIRVTPGGAGDAAAAQFIDDKAFYANVDRDTDWFIAALPTGIETFTQVRSPKSPEKHTLRFSLPEDATLERKDDGGVAIDRGKDRLATVTPVTAIDAQGRPVPVSYSIDGHELTMNVDHRGRDLAYPVMVDPGIKEPWRTDYEAGLAFANFWRFHTNQSDRIFSSVNGGWGEGPYIAMGNGWFNQFDSGQWYVQAPGTIFITRSDWMGVRQVDFSSSPNNAIPCVSVGFQTGDRTQWLGSPPVLGCGTFPNGNKEICAGNPPCAPNDMPAGNITVFLAWAWNPGSRNNASYAFVDNAYVYEHDLDRPKFSSVNHASRPTGWVESGSGSVSATIEDTGFGVKAMSMSRAGPDARPASGATPDTRLFTVSDGSGCDGNAWERCPATWSPSSSYRNWTQTFNYTTSGFPDGVNTMGFYALDALRNPSTGPPPPPAPPDYQPNDLDQRFIWGSHTWTYDSHTWTVKVDRLPPNSPIELSGPMANKYAGENPTLGTLATDPHSGVKSTELQVGGSTQVKERATPPCSADPGCPTTHDTRDPNAPDPSHRPFNWNTTGVAEGPHQYTVTAKDPLGHPRTESRTVKLDRTDPALTLSGELWARRFHPRPPSEPVPQTLPPGSYNLHLDSFDGFSAPPPNNRDGSGMKSFKVYVAGQRRDGSFLDYGPPKQEFGPLACPDGNCHMDDDWTFATSQYQNETGIWRIKVVAADQVGNESEQEFTVKIDQAGVSSADMLGLEDWWQYDSTPTGAGSAAHVNVANGNLVWHSVPVVNPGRGLSTVVNLTYNSQLRQPVPLLESPAEQAYTPYNEAGTGFSIGVSSLTRLNERLNVDLAAAGRVTLTDPDGTQHLFRSSAGSDVFNPPRGVNIHLRRFSRVEGLGTPDPTGYLPLEQPDKAWAATRPDGVTHFFDQRGYQTSVVDRNGNAITFDYQYRGPTRAVCQNAAAVPTFAPPEVLCPRKLRAAKDAGGREVTFTYEPRLISSLPPGLNPSGANDCKVTPPGGDEIEIPECASGPLSTITDHAGRTTRFRYTSDGYLSDLTLGAGGEAPRVFQLSYQKQGTTDVVEPLVAVTDPRGNRTKLEYHEAASPVSAFLRFDRKLKAVVDRNEEPAPESSPDPDGNEVQVADREKRTAFAYEPNLNLTTVTDTRGFDTKYEIGACEITASDRCGRLRELTDARGHKTKLEWDNEVAGQLTDDNNLARITRHAAGGAEAAATTMTYNNNGMLLTSRDPLGHVTTLTYANSGGPLALRSQRPGSIDSAAATFVSDLTQISRPKAGSDTQFVYDDNSGSAVGNVTERIDAEGHSAKTTYVPGGFGNIASEIDEEGNSTEYSDHDASGLPQTVVDPRDKTWRYTYDAVGNLLTAKDPRHTGASCLSTREKFRRQFEYDDFDQLVKEHVPKDGCDFIERTFRHDENGNRIADTDGNGQTTSMTYTRMDDVDRRISPATAHPGDSVPVDENGTRYEPNGDPEYADGRTVETTNLDYDTEENLTRVRSPRGELTSEPDDFATEYKYNEVGERVTSIRHNPGGSPAKLATGFAYDGRGNVIAVSDPANNAAGGEPEANAIDPHKRRFTFDYDLADNRRFATEDPRMPDDPPGEQGLGLRTEYKYDANDNLEKVIDPRGVATEADGDFETKYCYDDRDLLTDVIDGESNHARYVLRKDGKLSAEISPRGMPKDRDCDVAAKAGGIFRTDYDYFETGELRSRSLPKAPDQYAPVGRTVTYERNDVGDPITITDARNNTINNTFLDTGELASTTRPSWWTFDPEGSSGSGGDPLGSRLEGPAAARPGTHDTGEVRERKPEEMLSDDGKAPDLPRSEGFGDYGEVEPEEPPDLLPRTTNGDGGRTTFDYDDEMRLTGITPVVTGGGTPTVAVERDPLGRITETRQPLDVGAGRAIVNAFAYDHNGNLRTHQVSNEHEDADADRVKTTFDYDQFDRKIRETSPGESQTDLEKIELSYDANDNLTERETVGGTRWVAGYDAVDRAMSVTNPMGDGDDPGGEELGDADDETTAYTYDTVGNMLTETSPEGRATTRTYDAANRVKSIDGPLVAPTTYEYDENGNQVKMAEPGADGGDIVTERTFDGRDLKWSETVGTDDPRTTLTEYDPNGNLRRTVNPVGVSSTTNANGTPVPDNAWDGATLTRTSTAAENATVREYSTDNQLTSIHLPFGDPDGDGGADDDPRRWRQDFDRNTRGRVDAHMAPYDWSNECPDPPVNNDPGCPSTSTYTYFDTDWIRSMSDPQLTDPDPDKSYSQDVIYNYDARGNQVSWRSPKGQAIRRSVTRDFFPNGMLEQRRAVESDQQTSPRTYRYDYDRNHSMTEMLDVERARSTGITYDKAERPILVNESWTGGRDTAVFYDRDGATTTRRTDGTVSTAANRDTYSGGKTTSFRYDDAGREDRMWVCTDDVDAECSAAGEPERETETTYHTGSNFIHTRTKPNDVVETFSFLDDAKLNRMERDKGSNELKGQDYDYDDNGNRIEDERGEHLFNARSQLIEWARGPKTKDPGSKICYELNGAGAITKRTDSDDATCGAGDAVTAFSFRGDRIDSATATEAGHTPTTVDYQYDDFGSVEVIAPDTGPDTTFDYDEFGRMTKSRGPEETADRDYTFDGLDRRDTRTAGSAVFDFAYIGMTEKLSREEAPDGGGRKVHSYDYDSGLRRQGKQTRAGTVTSAYRSYAKDANGSVEGLEDGEGEFLGTPPGQPNYQYDPYGELEDGDDNDGDPENDVGDDEARENPFRFEGFYYDSGIKTYDMQARPYRPEIGRFLTQDRYESAAGDLNLEADPITQNRYAFAGGNPVNRIEWDGHVTSTEGFDSCGGGCENGHDTSGGRSGAVKTSGPSGSGTVVTDRTTNRATYPVATHAPPTITPAPPPPPPRAVPGGIQGVCGPQAGTPPLRRCGPYRRTSDHLLADLAGFAPGAFGAAADLGHAAWYGFGEGNWGEAGKTAVGAVPLAGDAFQAVRKGPKFADELAGAPKVGDDVASALPPDLKRLAEANLTGSGDTVLGHFRHGYIEKAKERGASYFDIGSRWNTLSRTQRTAVNDHFLDIVATRRNRVLLATPRREIRPGSPLAHEIQYLRREKGYRWVNQWSLHPP